MRKTLGKYEEYDWDGLEVPPYPIISLLMAGIGSLVLVSWFLILITQGVWLFGGYTHPYNFIFWAAMILFGPAMYISSFLTYFRSKYHKTSLHMERFRAKLHYRSRNGAHPEVLRHKFRTYLILTAAVIGGLTLFLALNIPFMVVPLFILLILVAVKLDQYYWDLGINSARQKCVEAGIVRKLEDLDPVHDPEFPSVYFVP